MPSNKGISTPENPFPTLIMLAKTFWVRVGEVYCVVWVERVEHLEFDKVAQALEIIKSKRRVKKLERRNKVKGRMIAEMDQDADVVLEDDKEVVDEAKEVAEDAKKVFANMRRVGKGFSGVETPLFKGMLVEQQVVKERDAEVHGEEVNAGDAAAGDVSAAHGEVPLSKHSTPSASSKRRASRIVASVTTTFFLSTRACNIMTSFTVLTENVVQNCLMHDTYMFG
nr:hypothetical protein [Tanacetum cinerariifolium]